MNARLASGMWVGAYLRRLDLEGIPAHVVARGDDTAGAVLVKLARLDGTAAAFQRETDLLTGGRVWRSLADTDEPEIDRIIARQRATDPDLWVIEIEDRHGRHLLDAPGLSD